jgi:hypothetical protein
MENTHLARQNRDYPHSSGFRAVEDGGMAVFHPLLIGQRRLWP